MGAARDLEWMVGRAAAASGAAMTSREDARAQAVAAIRDLERSVRDAVRGDTLRGLANLCSQRDQPARLGARVIGRDGAQGLTIAQQVDRVDKPIALGRKALVLTKEGELAVYAVDEQGGWSQWPAGDDELLAQDLDAVAFTVAYALGRHVARAERTAANYVRISKLAQALAALLSETRVSADGQ